MEERYEIKIVMDAVSRVAPAINSVNDQLEKMRAQVKLSSEQVNGLDRRMGQLERGVEKAASSIRSLNPTLGAIDRKSKSLSTTLTSVNRSFKTLDDRAGKAAGGLGKLAGIIDGLESKLSELDRKMTAMGAKTYQPKMRVNVDDAKVDATLAKLAAAERKKYKLKTGVEYDFADRQSERLYEELVAQGRGDEAFNLIYKLHVELDTEEAERQQAEFEKERIASEQRVADGIRSSLREQAAEQKKITQENEREAKRASAENLRRQKTEIRNLVNAYKEVQSEDQGVNSLIRRRPFDRQMEAVRREILSVAGVNVSPEVNLDTKLFYAEYLKVEEKLTALGLRREKVRVLIDPDSSSLEVWEKRFGAIADRYNDHFRGLFGRLRDQVVGIAITFSEPLLSAVVGIVGALTSVATAASAATAGLAGMAAAGVAQVVPAATIMIAALSRVAGVMKAVSAQQAAQDAAGKKEASGNAAAANAADALAGAHEGLVNAMRSVQLAQADLNDARREGIRTLTDLALAEERANLTAAESQRSLAAAVGSGRGNILDLQLRARSDSIAARRQSIDTRRAQEGGVEGLPRVEAAKRQLDDATRSVEQANRALKAAQRQADSTADGMGGAADALEVALEKLTAGERKLYNSVLKFQEIFQKGGPGNAITEPMVAAFADALDQITKLANDKELMAALSSLSEGMAGQFKDLVKFLTTGEMRKAFIFFAQEAELNLQFVSDLLKSILTIFKDIAVAASGAFGTALEDTSKWFERLAKWTSSESGQNKLAEFFDNALVSTKNFLGLFGSVVRLFAALAGAGGGIEESDSAIVDLTKGIDKLTEKVKANSEDVQKFFRDSFETAKYVIDIIGQIGKVLVEALDPESVKSFAEFFREVVAPLITWFFDVVGAASKAFTTLFSTPGLSQLLVVMGGWGIAMNAAKRIAGFFSAIASSMLLALNRVKQMDTIFRKPGGIGGGPGGGIYGGGGRGGSLPPAAGGGTGYYVPLPGGGTAMQGTPEYDREMERQRKQARNRRLGIGGLLAGAAASQAIGTGSTLQDAANAGGFSRLNTDVKALAGSALSLDVGGVFSRLFKSIPGSDKFKEFAASADEQIRKLASQKNIKGLQDLSKQAEEYAKQFPEYAEALGGLSETINNEIENINKQKPIDDALSKLRASTGNSLEGILTNTRLNARLINNTLQQGTTEHATYLAENFSASASAIDRLAKQGVISAKEANREIRKLIKEQFAALGVDSAQQIKNYMRKSGKDSGNEFKDGNKYIGGLAHGGWVGNQGERGSDRVNAWLGRGEAVLNWAHQKMVEPAMRAYYGSGLSEMFKRTRARHAGAGSANSMSGSRYASGGWVTGDTDFTPAMLKALTAMAKATKTRINVRDGRRTMAEQQHLYDLYLSGKGNLAAKPTPNAPHIRGIAADISPGRSVFGRIAGRFGLHFPVASEDWHAELVNGKGFSDIQTQVNNLTEAATKRFEEIRRVNVKGGNASVFGRVTQVAMDALRATANSQLRALAEGNPEADLPASGGGTPSKNQSLGRRMMLRRGWSPSEWPSLKALWTGESGWNEKAKNPSSGAYGIPQSLPANKMASAGRDWLTNAATQIKWGLQYIKDRYGSPSKAYAQWQARSPHWYSRGGFVRPVEWGGAQAEGGTYKVNKPTLFMAGEAGEEIASFTPKYAAGRPGLYSGLAPAANKIAGVKSDQQLASLSNQFALAALEGGNFSQMIEATRNMVAALRAFKGQGSKNLTRLAIAINNATDETSGVIPKLIEAVDARFNRTNTRGTNSATGALKRQSADLQDVGAFVEEELAAARTGLARARAAKNKTRIQTFRAQIAQLNNYKDQITNAVSQSISDYVSALRTRYEELRSNIERQLNINDREGRSDFQEVEKLITLNSKEILDLQIQYWKDNNAGLLTAAQRKTRGKEITDAIDNLPDAIRSGTFDRVAKSIENQQAREDALGRTTTTLLDAQIKATTNAIGDLTAGLAKNVNNPSLAQAFREKIDELNTKLVGLLADQLKRQIAALETQFSPEYKTVDMLTRLGQLGLSGRGQAVNGNFNIADLGRPNFGAIGSALSYQGDVLRRDRTATAELYDKAFQAWIGGYGSAAELTTLSDRLTALDTQLVENTMAIRDNTDAAFNDKVGRSQNNNSFLAGLNQGAQGILAGLDALSGVADKATQTGLLNQRASILRQTSTADRGFLGDLLGGIGVNTAGLGSASGNALVPLLTTLRANAIATQKLDDAQLTAMDQLITAIIQSETALLENTKALKDLGGSLAQTFSSTAWTTFRQAIFNGNAGLLPQYSIPQIHTGGYVTKTGVFELEVGERVLTPGQQQQGYGTNIEEMNTYITEPVEVLDERAVGRKIGFALSTSGRR